MDPLQFLRRHKWINRKCQLYIKRHCIVIRSSCVLMCWVKCASLDGVKVGIWSLWGWGKGFLFRYNSFWISMPKYLHNDSSWHFRVLSKWRSIFRHLLLPFFLLFFWIKLNSAFVLCVHNYKKGVCIFQKKNGYRVLLARNSRTDFISCAHRSSSSSFAQLPSFCKNK